MQRSDIRYYELAICGLYLDNLTFHSFDEIKPLTQVLVDLKSKKNLKAIVLKECQKPDFKTIEIKEITKYFLTPLQLELIIS